MLIIPSGIITYRMVYTAAYWLVLRDRSCDARFAGYNLFMLHCNIARIELESADNQRLYHCYCHWTRTNAIKNEKSSKRLYLKLYTVIAKYRSPRDADSAEVEQCH